MRLLGVTGGLIGGALAALALQACGGPDCRGGSRTLIVAGNYEDVAQRGHTLEISKDLNTVTERGREGLTDSVITYTVSERENR